MRQHPKLSRKSEPAPRPCWSSTLLKLEWAIAIAVTCIVVVFHFILWRHAGALWRDEANTLYIATLPSLSQLWHHLAYDSFPVLWFLIVRTWSALGFESDHALRLLGLLVGFLTLGALWWNARLFRQTSPLLALALFGFSPMVVFWGDSLRAYGIGALFGLLTMGSLWKYLFAPTVKNGVLAGFLALIAVQTLYHNAILLLAFGGAGALVAARHGWWKRAMVILGIGGLSALSLLPYTGIIGGYGEANKVQHLQSFGLTTLFLRLSDVLDFAGGTAMIWVWLSLCAVAIALGTFAQFRATEESHNQDLALFCLVALLIGGIGHFLFFKSLKLATMPWYYTILLAISAVTLEGIVAAWAKFTMVRVGRLLVLILFVITSWPFMQQFTGTRQTKMDLIAAELDKQVQRDDLVLVMPWFLNVSFRRYYHGSAPVMTVPPLENPPVHRYDLIAEKIAMDPAAAVEPVLAKVKTTLQSGHRVWTVGVVNFIGIDQPVTAPPPAPQSPTGWQDEPYYGFWSVYLGRYFYQHGGSFAEIPVSSREPVVMTEDPPLSVLAGWKE